MRLTLFMLIAATMLVPVCQGAQAATILKPEAVIEELCAFPHEGSANKLAPAYTYPEVRFIDACLRFKVDNFSGEKKLTVFITVSAEDSVLAKRKEKLKFAPGRYELMFPELLDLRKVFGERRLKLFTELALEGAPEVTGETFFLVKGRDLPQVEVLDFRLYPDVDSPYNYFAPGDSLEAEVVFSLSRSEDVPVTIRVVGVMDEETGFSIDPENDYQEYEVYWEEKRSPKRDDTYLLAFSANLPRYFYDYGSSRHPFTIYVVFLAEGETVRMVSCRDTIIDYYPGPQREVPDEVFRAIQVERAPRWRLYPLSQVYDEDRRRWSEDS